MGIIENILCQLFSGKKILKIFLLKFFSETGVVL